MTVIKKLNKKELMARMAAKEAIEKDRRLTIPAMTAQQAMDSLDTSMAGLSDFMVEASRDYYGENIITSGRENSFFKRLASAFVNPFTGILIALALVSLFTDVILAKGEDRRISTVIIITSMILLSGIVRFIQEAKSDSAAGKLSAMVKTRVDAVRKGKGNVEIPIDEVVVGDIVRLAAGDMLPADVRILSATDLFVNQSSMTGESEPVEKTAAPVKPDAYGSVTAIPNLAFMGSTVVSGSADCVVYANGDQTVLGEMSRTISKARQGPTAFDKGISAVSHILVRFMLFMVPVVFLLTGVTKGNWLSALLFAISIAVGLTPEMLPMIVTTCLAKGAISMSRRDTIIKNLNAIQNLGSMDILCTDKTGTLTQDRVVLEYHLDIHGNEDTRVLRHAFFNSYFQTGLKSLMDVSIIERTKEEAQTDESLRDLAEKYTKVDEIPFDFERRRLSVVVADAAGKTQLITKGAVEEMLAISKYAEYKGEVLPLTDELKKEILATVDDLNDDGMRVIAVAQKTNPSPAGHFSVADESDMVLMGYLAFLDPPKETSVAAIKALQEYGVETKILTGDNERVTSSICRKVGLRADKILLGADVEAMDDAALKQEARSVQVFAKLSPTQKARIVSVLRSDGHSVGYMGDGINDAAAMKSSDVGISVDNAVDIAKETADVILLKKDLMVLKQGIIEGRKVYANLIKYIKMTASSNFGNMFSVLAASAFLPFLPMAAIQLLLLNLIYDFACISIPWDNVDREFLLKPRTWNASSVSRFMLHLGPVSSLFDIATYLLMFFVLCPAACGAHYFAISDPALKLRFIALFQTGWFVESMWSQSFVIHMIRTEKIPFLQSRASWQVIAAGLLCCLLLTAIPFLPINQGLGLAPLPPIYFAWLALILLAYMICATIVKKLYIRCYGELL